MPAMREMAQLLQHGRPPSDVMASIAAEDLKGGPYQPCPCGSGKKLRFCHGDRAPQSPFSHLNPQTIAPHGGIVNPAHAELRSQSSSGRARGAAK
jgi:uncharacterized protein